MLHSPICACSPCSCCWRATQPPHDATQDAGHAPASAAAAVSGAAGTTAGLATHQWLEVDLGAHTPERWALPTALLLVCDPPPFDATVLFKTYLETCLYYVQAWVVLSSAFASFAAPPSYEGLGKN